MNQPISTVSYHLPMTFRSGYSSSEEEKYMILNLGVFPSFLKEGCHATKGHIGVVKEKYYTVNLIKE
jgi:hypothetical protein